MGKHTVRYAGEAECTVTLPVSTVIWLLDRLALDLAALWTNPDPAVRQMAGDVETVRRVLEDAWRSG